MSKKENFWIPYADLMTVLMVIFLFISLAYMAQQEEIVNDYQQSKKAIYSELDSTFREDFKKWNVGLDKDLSIKFNNPQVLFDVGSDYVKDSFQVILTNFIPKYLAIVMQPKYKDNIGEIRIEGHTDTKPTYKTDDPYIDNVILSQNRSLQVLKFFRKLPCFTELPKEDKKRLQFWLTANGLSYGRTLDNSGQLTFPSDNLPNEELSRRVEFRIVTTSEKLIDRLKQKKE
jgi:outer membrane protein OmpA-like peptidoglycan-associated protein